MTESLPPAAVKVALHVLRAAIGETTPPAGLRDRIMQAMADRHDERARLVE